MEEQNVQTQLVVFSLQDQIYSLPLKEVIEIIRILDITPIPGIAQYITGVINLRGNIVPVIDLRSRIGILSAEITPKSRIIIVKMEREQIGLIVNEILEITAIDNENIDPSPDMFYYLDREYFIGFANTDKTTVGILKLEKLIGWQ